MKKNTFYRKVGFIVMLLCACTLKAHDVSIIPQPLSLELSKGCFVLKESSVISFDEELSAQAEYLRDVIERSTGWELRLKEGNSKAEIILKLSADEIKHSEGYKLEVKSGRTVISGADEAGVFYGIQTFLQLFPAEIYSDRLVKGIDWVAPAVSVYDAPERPWRGMMLDVARYFYDKEFVKKYIDMMSMYKMNKLQFHLIDDSGWRLEIKKYPRLTEVGAWAGPDSRRLGGYYTQEDMKELIEYGKLRNVEIIPEIEFPAHMLSAVVAYPWLSCTEIQHEVPVQHFISRDLLCVGKESSFRFLEDVLEEVVNLFPSEYINIGGDEAVYSRWSECPKCREVMKREGFDKPSQLQGYLTNVVAEMMKSKKRTVVGWEEIIQRGKINNPVVAVMWHNVKDTIQATKTGHKAILSPATHTYFDFPESNTPGEVKAATWMPPISVEKCYSMQVNDYSPSSTVIGVQGCFWSDQFIHGTVLQEIALLNENRSENYAEYLTFPRMLALSEVAWCKAEKKNYQNFSERLSNHFRKLDYKDCHYRVPEPEIVSLTEGGDGSYTYELKSRVKDAKILYTTNGRYPNIHSDVYVSPVTVKDKSDFMAITLVNDRHYSLPLYELPDYSAYVQYGQFVYKWTEMQIQKTMSPMRFECTGKISGNGRYEITFIRTSGTDPVKVGKLRLFKRDELIAEVDEMKLMDGTENKITYSFAVESFEAGTPFFIEVDVCRENGNEVNGLVFIKKCS